SHRVRARLWFGQRVCADPFTACKLRQIFLLLGFCAKKHNRESADVDVRALSTGERWLKRELFADDRRADLVQAESAVLLGDVDREQAQLAGLEHKLAMDF